MVAAARTSTPACTNRTPGTPVVGAVNRACASTRRPTFIFRGRGGAFARWRALRLDLPTSRVAPPYGRLRAHGPAGRMAGRLVSAGCDDRYGALERRVDQLFQGEEHRPVARSGSLLTIDPGDSSRWSSSSSVNATYERSPARPATRFPQERQGVVRNIMRK